MTLVADFNSSVNVPFQRMRQMLLDGALQEGVVGANDLKVVQRGAGANQSVDVGAGFAWVNIDTGTRNGMGHVTNDATANVTVTASNATNPRVDQIILRWNDSSIPTGSGNVPTLEVLTGTATAGAQITAPQTTATYRLGAAALPNDCLRLADILVPATSTSVTTANIVDRRPWARGAYFRVLRNSNAAAGSNYTTTSTTAVAIDATNMAPRIECSGVPLRMTLRAAVSHSVQFGAVGFQPWVDGASVDGLGTGNALALMASPTVGSVNSPQVTYDLLPAAGSHVIQWAFLVTVAGTGTIVASASIPLVFTIEEIVRPSASNT